MCGSAAERLEFRSWWPKLAPLLFPFSTHHHHYHHHHDNHDHHHYHQHDNHLTGCPRSILPTSSPASPNSQGIQSPSSVLSWPWWRWGWEWSWDGDENEDENDHEMVMRLVRTVVTGSLVSSSTLTRPRGSRKGKSTEMKPTAPTLGSSLLIVIGSWFIGLLGENSFSWIAPSEFSSFKDIILDCEHIFWHILSGHCPNANFSQWMASPCSETAINRDWVCPH